MSLLGGSWDEAYDDGYSDSLRINTLEQELRKSDKELIRISELSSVMLNENKKLTRLLAEVYRTYITSDPRSNLLSRIKSVIGEKEIQNIQIHNER